MTVIVLNPQRRSAVLAVHAGFTPEEARELGAVYRCLGYADVTVIVTEQQQPAA